MSKVYLVGAGPGDPELLTLKGKRVLERADCVLYDNLANRALLDLAPKTAERIYVGKKKADHQASQEEICAMLIARARRGLTVVRLKGGDPFIFGRGGEEAEALRDAGVAFEVIPGITTPLGIAAYAGIPLTHREHTSVVTFVTGHDPEAIDWSKTGHAETLVIYMGLSTFSRIAAKLIANGRAAETPAAAVRWATRPDQEVLAGTLATLPGLILEHGLRPPATIIVGEVVRLRDRLSWFEALPLYGQRIVVTRPAGQSAGLTSALRDLGADVIELPAIEIVAPEDSQPIERAIRELSEYEWLIFTSANGVEGFCNALDNSSADWRELRARIAVIGPATRAAVEVLHLKVDVMAEEFVAESLAEALGEAEVDGKRVLLPRAAVARDTLPDELRRKGATVDVVEAYRSVAPENLGARAAEVFGGERRPDWITFTSSSTVSNIVQAAPAVSLAGIKVATIGPVTSATARRLGLVVTVEAVAYTAEGVAAAIMQKAHPP
jgi:uroporphyrinogen III methyltransferase/synthase